MNSNGDDNFPIPIDCYNFYGFLCKKALEINPEL